ncbi:MAG: hypothetical protein ABJB86_07810 [Bacteroidota bacterium]
MKKISIAILLLLAAQRMPGQLARSPLSARYTGISTYSNNFMDAFSGSNNQAALAQTKQASAGVYGERRFLLKELSNYAAAISLPSKWGGIGVSINYFGGENFNTSQLGLGYGKKLGDKIDIGIQVNYNMIKLSGYGNGSALNFEMGTILHLTDKVNIGIHVYNPVGGKFGKMSNEKLASVYSTGIGYQASDKFFISAEISKEEEHPVNINADMQYVFADDFFARLGVATETGNYFFGLGVQWKTFRVDAVTNWHAQLGITPAIMLLFNFHANKQSGSD